MPQVYEIQLRELERGLQQDATAVQRLCLCQSGSDSAESYLGTLMQFNA